MTDYLPFKFRPNGATANGKVYTYKAGTYIPKDTFPTKVDAINGTNTNANPVILDDRGEADIWIKGPTKVVLKNSEDNTLWTTDDFDSEESNILDANSNELIEFNGELDASNNIHITNATTSNSPIISAVGADTNIGIKLRAKGTGKVLLPTGSLTITVGSVIITSGDLNINAGDLNLEEGDVQLGTGEISINDSTSGYSDLPAGLVFWCASSTVPTGWLECNGAAVSRTTYANLFSAIGITYGAGNGSTTFNLPNQARRTLVGKGGTGTATLANTIGSTGGAETHTLTIAEMPSHNHSYTGPYDDFDSDQLTTADNSISIHPADQGSTTTSTGGGGAHNIMQPSLVSMMIIRAF